jgi:hypothetical protein
MIEDLIIERRDLSVLQSIQTSSMTPPPPASYSVGTGGSFPISKAAGAQSCLPSWHAKENFTFTMRHVFSPLMWKTPLFIKQSNVKDKQVVHNATPVKKKSLSLLRNVARILWLWLMMSCTWMIIVCCVDHTGNMAA